MAVPSSPSPTASKPRYEILDGLRGVAAVTVVFFHFFEIHGGGDPFVQIINHGYLAVDFFFLLSGFVIGYAYDDRWSQLGLKGFFKRRLIRLHPMVVMGTLVGASCYYFGVSSAFPPIAQTPIWKFLLITLAGIALFPVPPSWEIRGWSETFPLNGPAWSLFFEYLANLAYAVVLRRINRGILILVTLLAGFATFYYLLNTHMGDIIGGWSLAPEQVRLGLIRLAYPFLAGLLLFRLGRRITVKHGFWVCSFALALLLAWPRLGDRQHVWTNALYEAIAITVLFPVIVAAGAGSRLEGQRTQRVCIFLGRLSYPLYITHYPLVYLYTAYLSNHHVGSFHDVWPVTLGALAAIFAVAYLALRWYDEPLRAYLSRRFASK